MMSIVVDVCLLGVHILIMFSCLVMNADVVRC